MVGDLMSYYSLPQRLAVKREEEKNKKKKKRSFSIHFAIDRYEQGGITQLMVCLPETDNPSRGNQLSFIHTA